MTQSVVSQQKKTVSNHRYTLQGLTCASCAAKIEKAVRNLPQVEEAELNFAAGTITVQGKNYQMDSFKVNLQKVVDRIEPGVIVKEIIRGTQQREQQREQVVNFEEHDRNIENRNQEEDEAKSYLKLRFIPGVVLFFLALVLFELGLTSVSLNGLNQYIKWLFYGSSYLLIGGPVLRIAYNNIKRGHIFDENFLMTVATMGAFAIQEFPEGVAVMFFYMVGEMFQEKAVERSRRSIKSLMDIRPEFANLKKGKTTIRVNPEQVRVGDVIIIKPGERVPLDGEVLEGSSRVDTSALTGESVPRKLESGDAILSGMINKEGLLTVRVKKEYNQSTVAKILDLVQNASSKKAPTEKFITKFSRYYTPVVVYSALAIAILPSLFIPGASLSDWVYRALIFLVISCPCALVVSIPLGFFGGIGRASRQGILVKGGNYLEALNNVTRIVFDKTGTLTKGQFAVSKVEAYNRFDREEILAIAALIESQSNHPIAKSIMEAYGKGLENLELSSIENYQEISGLGIKASINGQEVLAGNSKLLDTRGIVHQEVDEDGTVVYLAVDDNYAGYITISDELKEDSIKAVEELKRNGIKEITMLTGDRSAVAQKISRRLGIDRYYAELLPGQKVEKIEEILSEKNKNEKLVFVGDGINDAPVLARSDIGVAMGGLGSDAAIEAADIVLMTDEPFKLVTAIKTARKTKNIVWQNIIMALGIKGIVLFMGVLGIATMWGAVFADVGVALLAVLNAMRISRNVNK